MVRISFPNCVGEQTRLFSLVRVLAAVWMVFALSVLPASGQSLDSGYVTVRMGVVTPHLEAYSKVELSGTLEISFAEPGVVAGLEVQPDTTVRAGQELAHLTGPAIRSVILQSQARVRSAHVRLARVQRSLANLKRKLSSLRQSTGEEVRRAQRAVAQARMTYKNALLHLRAVGQTRTLRAPVDGTVLMLSAMDGEHVSAAEPILTLQTPYRLWLTGYYYGTDLSVIRPGMTGKFLLAKGSQPIPVRVCAVAGLLKAGGGEAITMLPVTPTPKWIDGEFGTVTLNLPKRLLVVVPTRSLILDQGKWWVLVHTPQGDHPQAVVLGPTRGWETFLEDGLSPGAQVVVENAYLLFHRNISQHYQPPD